MADSYGLPDNLPHYHGRRALAIARLFVAMARHPKVQRFVVFETPGGPKRGTVLKVIPAGERPFVGELVGIYDRDVTLGRLLEDLEVVDDSVRSQQGAAA